MHTIDKKKKKKIALTVVSYRIKKDKREPGGLTLNPTEKHPE